MLRMTEPSPGTVIARKICRTDQEDRPMASGKSDELKGRVVEKVIDKVKGAFS
jgi:hypothetical protein